MNETFATLILGIIGGWLGILLIALIAATRDFRKTRREREELRNAEDPYVVDGDHIVNKSALSATVTWVSAEDSSVIRVGSGTGDVLTKTRTNIPEEVYDSLKTNPRASNDASDEEISEELMPGYEIGEKIIVFNPHISYPVFVDDNEAPEHHEILDVKWDEEDTTHRYLIDGEHIWIAEEWLVDSFIPQMAKNSLTSFVGRDKVVLDLDKAFSEEVTKQVTVDSALDLMNSGVEEERELGLRMIKEITAQQVTGEATKDA